MNSTDNDNDVNTLPDEILMNRICVFRGQKVMLDRDLAELYGVETKRLNEQVRRNSTRFPEDFMFEMSKEEFENWRSQFVIPDKKVLGAPKVQENLNGGM